MEKRIVLVVHGNESMVTVGTTGRLCENEYTFTEPENPSKAYTAFKKSFKKIHGVERAEVGRHEVRIERFDAFRWNDFIPAVVKLVAKRSKFGDDYKVYVKDERPTHRYEHDSDGYPMGRGEPLVNEPIDFGLETETF